MRAMDGNQVGYEYFEVQSDAERFVSKYPLDENSRIAYYDHGEPVYKSRDHGWGIGILYGIIGWALVAIGGWVLWESIARLITL